MVLKDLLNESSQIKEKAKKSTEIVSILKKGYTPRLTGTSNATPLWVNQAAFSGKQRNRLLEVSLLQDSYCCFKNPVNTRLNILGCVLDEYLRSQANTFKAHVFGSPVVPNRKTVSPTVGQLAAYGV